MKCSRQKMTPFFFLEKPLDTDTESLWSALHKVFVFMLHIEKGSPNKIKYFSFNHNRMKGLTEKIKKCIIKYHFLTMWRHILDKSTVG